MRFNEKFCPICNSTHIVWDSNHFETVCFDCGCVLAEDLYNHVDIDVFSCVQL